MAITIEQAVPFSAEVSRQTGLDFYTIEGWVRAENGPADNPLGIMHPGTQQLEHYGTLQAAAAATAQLLQTPTYRGVIATARPHDQLHGIYPGEDKVIAAQAHAIAYSPWKGNDGLPRSKYEQNIDAGATLAIYEGLNPRSTVVAPGGKGGPQVTRNPVNPPTVSGGILGPLLELLQRWADWWGNPENWKRIALGVGGLVLVVGGLVLVVKG